MTWFLWTAEVLRGKSYSRAFQNRAIARAAADCTGRWLDIGGGVHPSYTRFLPSSIERVHSDLKGLGAARLDANEKLPFSDGSFNGAFALNMLYILRDPRNLLGELRRIIKPEGMLIATFPFFFPERPEPHDFHRWTQEGVRLMMEASGWDLVILKPLGGRWTIYGSLFLPGRRLSFIRWLFAPLVWLFDARISDTDMTTGWFVVARQHQSVFSGATSKGSVS